MVLNVKPFSENIFRYNLKSINHRAFKAELVYFWTNNIDLKEMNHNGIIALALVAPFMYQNILWASVQAIRLGVNVRNFMHSWALIASNKVHYEIT